MDTIAIPKIQHFLFYLLIMVSAFTPNLASAALIFSEGFETDGNGTRYVTSISEFSDGSSDFFTRTNGSNISTNYQVNGYEGDYFFTAQDIDGEGAQALQNLVFEDIDISLFSNLIFNVDIAEDDDGSSQDWDAQDFVSFAYQIDNGGYTDFLAFEAQTSSGSNFEPAIDTNYDGIGDGQALSSDFQTFTTSIIGKGTLLDIQITFSLNSGDEDIAIDNLNLTGTTISNTVAVSAPPTFVIMLLSLLGLIACNSSVTTTYKKKLSPAKEQ
ncbi:MAG: hypothetical protein MK214_04705 [Thalassotalea sp.]|nr:hypothetical protein [Thalassotalea sp.]